MSVPFWRKILRVDLSSGDIWSESLNEDWYRTYLGGWGLIAYILVREVPGNADPLGPENRLVFAPGVMTGIRMGGSGRNAVGAKSPLTGGFGEADVGGFWGAELKRAGWDGIVIQGVSAEPVYLWIQDGDVELRDARHLWGRTTREALDSIVEELGDRMVRVSQIGPAGENLARHACIMNGLNHAAGRCGLGAVMGSKRLRAIAVRGTQDVGVADDSVVRGIPAWTKDKLANDLRIQTLHDFGQAGDMIPQNEYGGLPTRNFRQGSFEAIDRISGEYMAEHLRVRGDTCYACGIACKSVVSANEPYAIDERYGGPEYESIAALGSNCAIDSMEAICKANELCNAFGLDTIGVGGTMAWAMEAYERGLIPSDRLGGLQLDFGCAETLLTLIEQIARREGMGDWLANGAYACAQDLGQGSDTFVVHVKGQEVPMHDPRLKYALAVGYATSPTGADHMHNIHDTLYETSSGLGDLRALGILSPLPVDDLSPAKMRMAKHTICWNVMWDCVGLCQIYRFDRFHMRDLVASSTGWNLSIFELQAIGERAYDLAREFNRMCGKGPEDDTVPPRLLAKLENGVNQGNALPERDLADALHTFYDMMGWDHGTGAPHNWKLEELGLDWVVRRRGAQ